MATLPAYTVGGITRPELQLDTTGHIVLDDAASAFANTYGLKALYWGCPPSTPWPPVFDSISTPTDSNPAANSVAEGAPANTPVNLTVSATSAAGRPVTYSLTSDSSAGGFQIDAHTGVVSVANGGKIDFESSPGNAYSITVKASDGIVSRSQTFTIGVNDVAPSTPADSNAAANTVQEGAANGTAVGVTASSNDVNGGTITYSLTGDTSGGGFTINSTTGVVTVADTSKIDYESAPGHAYTVTARASDGTLTSSQSFSIAVTDVAIGAPIDSNAAANTVAEGAAANTLVGITASATDPNGPATSYSLVGDTSGGGFKIDAATGVVSVADATKIDYESSGAGRSYNITVQATNGPAVTTQTFTVAVSDVAPSTPVDSSAAANTVAEGAVAGSTVGVTASSTDVNGPAVTYSLTGDTSGGGFTINAATGVVTVADPSKIDYESAPGHAYSVTAQASDGTLTSSQSFSIAVSDVAPSIPVDSNAASNAVAEGAVAGSTVGITASSTDVNGPAVTYSLTGDTSGGGFTINATTGAVTVADPTKIDYETSGGSYTITAQASDGTLTSSQSFAIAVSDVAPSAPTDSDAAANTVAEGAVAGSTVGVTASSTDVNGPAVTYSLTGDTSGGGFTINAATGVVTVADPSKIDYESAPGHAYSVTAQASDGTLTSSQSFSIAVSDVAPSTPVDSNAASNTVAEGAVAGSTVGVTASSTDVNGPAVTYSLTGDTSGGGFTINATTGVVTVADPSKIDYETSGGSYTITAQASDGSLTNSQIFAIAVTDVAPSTPIDNDATANQVAVSSPAGSTVGITASSTDVNGPAVTYSLVGDTSGGGFTINSATGQVTVADPSKIQAADPSYDITVDATDGTLHSQQTFTIAVVIDAAPVVTANSTLSYTENQAATAIDTGLTVTDSDNATLAHATVQITGNYVNGEDVLGFTDQNGITGSFNAATGTLTLTGSASVANYQTALESVTYFNASDSPSSASRTVTFIANDGTLNSAPATSTINVTPVNDAPVVTAGHTLNYTENQAATAIDPAITVSDADNANLASATVQISSNYVNGEDVLGFSNTANITGSFNAATGTLTLTGADTVAAYQAALASVTYVNTSENPSGLVRTVTITANDGSTNSTAATDTINVTPVNDAPVVTAGHALNYTENQAATAIDTAITVSDVDSANLASATVQITGNYVNGEDVLGFTTQNGITGSFNAATGTMTLSGSSSVANYQAALESVTYHNTSENPSGLDRTITVTANDGTANSTSVTDTIHVTPVNDAPVVTFNTLTGFTEPPNGTPASSSAPVTIAPSLTISDVDSTELNGATFVLNNLKPSDALSVSGHAGSSGDVGGIHFDITSTASTETVTFTGHDTIANYNAVLDLVQFNNTSENPDQTARSYTVTAVDDGGTANGGSDTGAATATETVTGVNDAPTETVPSDSSVGTAYSHTDLAISGLSVADVDGGSGNETATISALHGSLSFTTTGLSSFTNNGSHTVTLTGTVAQVNTALSSLVYNSDNGFTGTDTLTLNVNDNGNTGSGGAQPAGNSSFHVGVVPQVFYINNFASGSSNAGTPANPYTSIAAFNAANPAGSGDYVVLEHGTGTYSEANGINLNDGVSLVGGDETLTFTNPVTGQVVTANSASGTAPIIQLTAGSTDNGIDVFGSNSLIQGVYVDTHLGSGGGIIDHNASSGTDIISDVHVTTGSGAGISFTHGGTLTINNILAGATNSISSGTGTALNIVNTNIGSGDLTFHDISANGGSNGIVLDTTGTSGGLKVTGTGTTVGSGGVIQNMTGADGTTAGAGIYLNNTAEVSLNGLNLHDFSNHGIFGLSVNGIKLTNSTISGTVGTSSGSNDLNLEAPIEFGKTSPSISNGFATGSSSEFDNVNISGGIQHNVEIYQDTGTFNLTITNSNIHSNGSSLGSDGVNIETTGTAHAIIDVDHTIFNDNKSQALQASALGNSFLELTLDHNQVSRTTQGNEGFILQNGANGDLTTSITNNTFGGTAGGSIQGTNILVGNVAGNANSAAELDATISNNTMSLTAPTNRTLIAFMSSSAGQTPTTKLLIDGNTINTVSDPVNGIAEPLFVSTPDANTSPLIYATVTNNTVNITDTNGTALRGIAVQSTQTTSVMHADVRGNDVNYLSEPGGASSPPGVVGIRVREVSPATLDLEPGSSGSNVAATVLADNNPLSTTQVVGTVTASANNNTALLPATPTTPTPPAFLTAKAGGIQATTPTPGETHLTQAELQSVVAAAISQWAHAGASASQLALLATITFSVADLAGNSVGKETSPTHITIDTDAAGHGWFIDPTPSDSFEFAHAANGAGTDLYTDPANAAAGHLDLLTAVTHEMGHVLGLTDATAASAAHDLMYINLVDGERRLPAAADVALANAATPPDHIVSGIRPAVMAPVAPHPPADPAGGSATSASNAVAPQAAALGGTDQFVFAATHGGPGLLGGLANFVNILKAQGFDFSSPVHGPAFSDPPSAHQQDSGPIMPTAGDNHPGLHVAEIVPFAIGSSLAEHALVLEAHHLGLLG